MSDSGQTLHFRDVRVASAFNPIANVQRTSREVGSGPNADICALRASGPLSADNIDALPSPDLGRLVTAARTIRSYSVLFAARSRRAITRITLSAKCGVLLIMKSNCLSPM
jgi:hypothetical protein